MSEAGVAWSGLFRPMSDWLEAPSLREGKKSVMD